MENSFMTETTETGMTMDNLYLLTNYDVSKDRKEGKYGWEGGFSVDYKEWYMVDFKTVGEISNSSTTLVCMSDYDDFVSSIDKLLYIISELHTNDVD